MENSNETQVQIKITGGINGNRTILNALNSDSFPKELPFGNYLIDYPDMATAIDCLRLAHMELREEGAELINSRRMTYDSSRAEIVTEEIF